MIYCVVPPELEAELFDRLVAYYGDKPDVTVVVDRRAGERRASRSPWNETENRQAGNRRRSGPGGFVSTNVRDP
ncbi:MAG TPA: hypothetical protein VG265_03970 [Gaiellaceae bacterium]|nr:hypothetical protein [Gaiellaceae bacterium]